MKKEQRHDDEEKIIPDESGNNIDKKHIPSGKKIGKINRWVRRNIFPILVAGSLSAHIAVPAAASLMDESLPEKIYPHEKEDHATKLLKKSYSERTAVRKNNVDASMNDRIQFEEKIKTQGTGNESYENVIAQQEMFEEGIEGQIIASGKRTLENLTKPLAAKKPQVPDADFLQKVKDTFSKPGSGNDTASIAYEALAIKGLPEPDAGHGVQNCYSTTKQLAMAMDSLYPKNKQAIQVQQFVNHVRLIYQVGEKKFVMDPNEDVQLFQEQESQTTSRMMSYESYLKLSLGVQEENIDDITYYGPEIDASPAVPPVTDQLSKTPHYKKPLGLYTTDPIPTEVSVEANRQKQKKIEKILEPPMLELYPTSINVEEAKKIIAETNATSERLPILSPIESPEAAREIAKFQGLTLELYDGELLTPEIAREIAKSQVLTLKIYDGGLLTPEAAREIAKFKGNLELNEGGLLTPEAAREIAKFQGPRLVFNRTNPTPESTREIGKYFKGALRYLGTNTDLETIEELTKSKNKELIINFETLTSEAVSELSKKHYKFLGILARDIAPGAGILSTLNTDSLGILTDVPIDETAAEELSKLEMDSLNVKTTKITSSITKKLSKSKAKTLNIQTITLEEDSAKELVPYNGNFLTIVTQEPVSEETKKALAPYKGKVSWLIHSY